MHPWFRQWAFVLIESLLTLVAFAWLSFRRQSARPGMARLLRAFDRLAERRSLSVIVVTLLALSLRVALIPLMGVPVPKWHDEFSYLLAADTFVHGRLANPTHPMWVHFETFHVIFQPTYSSIYPPAQGVILAFGQLLGNPWIGQLLATGAFCGALCWMLQGWLPPRWALLGALLAVLRFSMFSYWINSYWSSSIAALGGALVCGALPRLRHPRLRDAIWMALGLTILANSRPYEGFILALVVAVALLREFAGTNHAPFRRILLSALIPICALLLVTAIATGYFYKQVTGSPFKMTYQLDRQIYGTVPFFLWQAPLPEPTYHHAVLQDFYEDELDVFEHAHTFRGFFMRKLRATVLWWDFYFGLTLTIPLIALPWVIRQRRARFAVYAVGAVIVSIALESFDMPHYFAPATAPLWLLLVHCLRELRHWHWKDRPVGDALVRTVVLISIVMIPARIAIALDPSVPPFWEVGNQDRARIQRRLENMPGQQLVIVRYEADHDFDQEWVYNAADIDASKVVWARDMGTRNQELFDYYKDRHVWLLELDRLRPEIESYK